MRAVPILAWRLLRGSGKRGLLTTGLSAFAVAISTALLLLTLGVNHGFGERAERESWLYPQEATDNASAIMAVSTDFVRGRPIAVVNLAVLNDDAPTPPGMIHFPEIGEVWMSPALAGLSRELPPDELAQRFGSPITAELGREALMHPGQLIAVVGTEASALSSYRVAGFGIDPYATGPTPISSFSGSEPDWAVFYRGFSAFATVLVVVPLIALGSAAGRLATAQRDRRLATMRLIGATPAQVVAITTFETILIGFVGAFLGAGAYAVSLPLTARVTATGGTWFVSDLWVGAGILLVTLLAVPLVVGMSALMGLRSLVISPLGVSRRQKPRGAGMWRLLLFVALLIGYGIVAPSIGLASAVLFAFFFAVLFLAVSIMGPFVVSLLGRVMVMVARSPEGLLAARRLVDDPYSAWRVVGGITMAAFVAGFLVVMIPQDLSVFSDPGSTNRLYLAVPDSEATSTISGVQNTLREHDIMASVSKAEFYWVDAGGDSLRPIGVDVGGNEDNLDRARTALSNVSPSSRLISGESFNWETSAQFTDIRNASVLVLTVSLAVASASAAIVGVTGVLDRRQLYSQLRLGGAPLGVLNRARLRETLVPLVLLGGGALLAGMFCAAPLAATASIETSARGIVTESRAFGSLATPAIFAVLGVAFADLASRLTLRSTTRDPTAYRQ